MDEVPQCVAKTQVDKVLQKGPDGHMTYSSESLQSLPSVCLGVWLVLCFVKRPVNHFSGKMGFPSLCFQGYQIVARTKP